MFVTSYEMVRFDASAFQRVEWFYLIVDEGHRLKNNECQLMQCLFTFAHSPNTSRLILTGTPLQVGVFGTLCDVEQFKRALVSYAFLTSRCVFKRSGFLKMVGCPGLL